MRTAHPAGVHVLRVYRCESAAEASALAIARGRGAETRPASIGEVAPEAVAAAAAALRVGLRA